MLLWHLCTSKNASEPMLLCAYAKLAYMLYPVYPFPFVARSPGVSFGFPTSSLYLASRLQKRDLQLQGGPKNRGPGVKFGWKIEARQFNGTYRTCFFLRRNLIILNLGVSFHGKLDDFHWILEAKASSSRVLGETYSSGCRCSCEPSNERIALCRGWTAAY